MSDEIEEVLVPCPSCRKVHKVPVNKIKENAMVKMDCGATLGSAGLMRRVDEAEARAKAFRSRLHKLG